MLIYTSCKKQSNNKPDVQNSETPLVAEARNWFVNTIVKNEAEMLALPDSALPGKSYDRMYARMAGFKGLLQWNNARQYMQNGVEYVIVQLKESNKSFSNKNFEAQRGLAVYKDKTGSMHMNILEIVSSKGGALGNSFLDIANLAFANKYLNKNIVIFNTNASIIFYNEKYIHESSFKIINGAWTAMNIKFQNEKGGTDRRSAAKTMARAASCGCQTYYLIGVWYDQDTHEVVDYEILDEYTECDGSGKAPGSGYGSEPSPPDDCNADAAQQAQQNTDAVANSFQAIAENLVSSTGIESTDVNGVITRPKAYDWDFGKNTFGSLTWRYKSSEDGVQKKVGGVWLWQSLTHNTIVQLGNSPFETTLTLIKATSSFHDNNQYAKMELKYSIIVKIYCFGTPIGSSGGNDELLSYMDNISTDN